MHNYHGALIEGASNPQEGAPNPQEAPNPPSVTQSPRRVSESDHSLLDEQDQRLILALDRSWYQKCCPRNRTG